MGLAARLLILALLGAVSPLISSCGSSGDGGGGTGNAPTNPIPPPSSPPLISGSETALISAALGTATDKPLTSQDVSHGFLLSRLLVSFKANATVGQVNAAARVVGATRITSSEPTSLLVALEVPRQASVAALQALAKSLRAQPGVAFAAPGQTAKASVLPEFSPGVPISVFSLAHLLGNRFPQAWNARQAMPADCLARSVSVYVFDQFGPASNRPDFFNQVERSSFFADPNGMAAEGEGHGYDVVSTLAAKFDADTPTGANPFPDCVVIHAIEDLNAEYVDAIRRALHAVAADPDPRVILTISMNFGPNGFCGINGDQPCDATTTPLTVPEFVKANLLGRALIAAEWSRLMRSLSLVDKALITQSAGNIDDLPDGFLPQNYQGFRDAALSSPAALASHLFELKALLTSTTLWKSATAPGLPDFSFSAQEVDDLIQLEPALDPINAIGGSGLLIVDSGTPGETPADVMQSSFDILGADLRAVGQDVVLSNDNVNGTSFSTPLVAGLAAYLWNLSPALVSRSSAVTAELLRRSSFLTANSPTVPVLDAYAAVLRLDDVPGCCTGASTAPIRLGLVDVDGDGGFTGLDLQKFSEAFGLQNPNPPSIPDARDFSRFDLNGDGYTGGIPFAAFDLDVNGLDAGGQPVINATDAVVENVHLSFNEAALTDLQILCYYAYSPLYFLDPAGQNESLRTSLLGPEHCVGARLTAQLPPRITAPTAMNVTVELPGTQGHYNPAPNLLVKLTPTCARVNPDSGRTDANGVLATTVTPTTGCGPISVKVVASADTGTPPLAQQTVTSTSTAVFAGSVIDGLEEPQFTECTNICRTHQAHVRDAYTNLRFELQPDGTFTATGDYEHEEHSNDSDDRGCGTEITESGTGVVTAYTGTVPHAPAGFIEVTATITRTTTSPASQCGPGGTSSQTQVQSIVLGSDTITPVFAAGSLIALNWDRTLTDQGGHTTYRTQGTVVLQP